MATRNVLDDLVEQIARLHRPLVLVPEMMVRIADRQIRFERRLLHLVEPRLVLRLRRHVVLLGFIACSSQSIAASLSVHSGQCDTRLSILG